MVEIKKNNDVSYFEKTSIMEKLSACRQIQSALREKHSPLKKNLQKVKLWYAYTRMDEFINTEGKEGSFSDDKLTELADFAGLKLRIDYSFDN